MLPEEVDEMREVLDRFERSGISASDFDGSTSRIVDVLSLPRFSGRAGNFKDSFSSSLILRPVRVGVDGEDVACEKRDDRDGEIECLKLARVSSSDETLVPVEIRLPGKLCLFNEGGYRPSSIEDLAVARIAEAFSSEIGVPL
jgi:hypothetical protein